MVWWTWMARVPAGTLVTDEQAVDSGPARPDHPGDHGRRQHGGGLHDGADVVDTSRSTWCRGALTDRAGSGRVGRCGVCSCYTGRGC